MSVKSDFDYIACVGGVDGEVTPEMSANGCNGCLLIKKPSATASGPVLIPVF